MRFDAVLHPPLPPRRAAVAALTLLLTVGIASAATVVAAAATELQAVAKGASKPVASQSTTKSDITITADSVWTDHGHTIYVGSPTLRIAGQYPTRVKVDGRPVVGDLDYHSGQIKRVELWQRSSPQVAAHGGDAQHDVIEVTLTR